MPDEAPHHHGNDHWRAGCRETGLSGSGRGRRKRTHTMGTSSAAYFTLWEPRAARPGAAQPRSLVRRQLALQPFSTTRSRTACQSSIEIFRDTHVRQRPHQVRVEEGTHVIPQGSVTGHPATLPGSPTQHTPFPLTKDIGAPPTPSDLGCGRGTGLNAPVCRTEGKNVLEAGSAPALEADAAGLQVGLRRDAGARRLCRAARPNGSGQPDRVVSGRRRFDRRSERCWPAAHVPGTEARWRAGRRWPG